MILRRIYDPTLAQAAYLVGCPSTREAILIDPACDIDRYLAAAEAEGLRITAVAETHVHADFVSGAPAFAAHHAVTVYLSAEGSAQDWVARAHLAPGARIELLHAGDAIRIGTLEFRARHTPGHTRESLCYELTRPGTTTRLLFSGDFLFAGDVGRPDLGAFATEGLSLAEAVDKLRASLVSIEDLPSDTQVLPGHGAGSECGKAICNIPATTIGIERVINRALKAQVEGGDFKDAVLAGATEPPPYFARVKRMNEAGARGFDAMPMVRALSAAEFGEFCQRPEYTVIDTRAWNDYLDARLPYSISAPFEKSFGPTVANYLEEDDRIVLIADPAKVTDITRVLLRVGVAPESIVGFVDPRVVSTLAVGSFATIGVDDISPVRAHELVERSDVTVLDVRTCSEFAAGHLPGAQHIPYTHLRARLDDVARGKPILCYCRSGNRSARAAAFLARSGFEAFNMRGGFWPYAGRGYRVER